MENIILKFEALGKENSITFKPADTKAKQVLLLQKLYQLERRENSMKDVHTVLGKV